MARIDRVPGAYYPYEKKDMYGRVKLGYNQLSLLIENNEDFDILNTQEQIDEYTWDKDRIVYIKGGNKQEPLMVRAVEGCLVYIEGSIEQPTFCQIGGNVEYHIFNYTVIECFNWSLAIINCTEDDTSCVFCYDNSAVDFKSLIQQNLYIEIIYFHTFDYQRYGVETIKGKPYMGNNHIIHHAIFGDNDRYERRRAHLAESK